MNQAFEGSGCKTFAIVPLTTSLRPGFVLFDTRAIGEVLHIGQTSAARSKSRAQGSKRKEERKNGTYKTKKEKKELKEEEKKEEKQILMLLELKEKTEKEIKRAKRHEIRGIHRCQNVECGIILNHDRNGSTNIATNFRRGYCKHPWLRVMTKQDQALEESQDKLDKLVQPGSTVGATQLRGSLKAEPVLEILSDEVGLRPS